MPRLEDLRQDVLTMSEGELLSLIRHVREDRKLRKFPQKTAKQRAVQKETIHTTLAKLSDEELEVLLREEGVL